MKKLIGIFAALILVAVGFLWWNGTRRSSDARQPMHTAASRDSAPDQTSGGTNTVLASTELKRPENVTPELWARVLAYRASRLGKNQPVDFFCRVVDQHNVPVPGARLRLRFSYVDESLFQSVDFVHMQMGDEIKRREIVVESDHSGLLELTGQRGLTVDVIDLNCEGYSWEMPKLGSFDYGVTGARRVGYVGMEKAFDKNQRYTFVMWKKGETERVIPLSLRIDLDNTVGQGQWVSNYFIGFMPPRVEWTNFAEADLQIRGIRRSSGNPDLPFEFTFTLNVPAGGIAQSADVYPYQAPAAGYQTSWSFDNKPHLNPRDYPWTKTAYLKLREGRAYAGLTIGFCKGGFDFQFDGYLNPGGSRNLEPHPEKLITDPQEIRRLEEQTRLK